jgi:hypothetical protein
LIVQSPLRWPKFDANRRRVILKIPVFADLRNH